MLSLFYEIKPGINSSCRGEGSSILLAFLNVNIQVFMRKNIGGNVCLHAFYDTQRIDPQDTRT